MKKIIIGNLKHYILHLRDRYLKKLAANIMFNDDSLLHKVMLFFGARKLLTVFFVWFFNFGAIYYRKVFDARWYSAFYPDSKILLSPLIFHVFKGEELFNNTSFLFHTKNYTMQNNIDIKKNSPLLHFLLIGTEKNRNSNFLCAEMSDKLMSSERILYRMSQMFNKNRKHWDIFIQRNLNFFVSNFNDVSFGFISMQLNPIPYIRNVPSKDIKFYSKSPIYRMKKPKFYGSSGFSVGNPCQELAG